MQKQKDQYKEHLSLMKMILFLLLNEIISKLKKEVNRCR